MKTDKPTTKFAIEEHPVCGCILYLVITFLAEFFIDNVFYAMCLVDLLIYLYIFIRRTLHPIKRPVYTVNTWLIGLITVICLIVTTYCWSRWYMHTIADSSSSAYVTKMSNADVGIYLFMIAIAAPLGEESLFRYVVVNGFLKIFEKVNATVRYSFSIILSAIIFAAMHGTGVHLLVGFFCGLALAIAYCTTNKLSVSIVIHSLYNIGTLFLHVPLSLPLCIVLTIFSFILTGIMIHNLCHNQISVKFE